VRKELEKQVRNYTDIRNKPWSRIKCKTDSPTIAAINKNIKSIPTKMEECKVVSNEQLLDLTNSIKFMSKQFLLFYNSNPGSGELSKGNS